MARRRLGKIVSGDVEGYIASNYLACGKEAEKLADKFAEKYATVIRTQTLRVREEPNLESRTLELIPLGERFPNIEEQGEWVKILLSSDDQGNDFEGYVHKDYVDISNIQRLSPLRRSKEELESSKRLKELKLKG